MARMVMMALCVVVTCMVVAAPYTEAVGTCIDVVANLAACLGPLTVGGPVTPASCDGMQALNASATVDAEATCDCVRITIAATPGINLISAALLPDECDVNLNFTISPNADC